ncbi:MAG: T9SS type A sorting domain-containing protein [Flavobacteriaceae bacterium]|nr:T9SS type A sorting domain-containing protein [Aequorivita sp.]
MKSKITLFFLFTVTINLFVCGQTIWNGPTMTFSKSDYADWTLEQNQDRITPNVWITRKNNQPIFNIAQQTGWPGGCGGIITDTEWAVGTTANLGSLTFNYLTSTDVVGCALGNDLVGTNLVLHLITDDIYIDLVFTSWTESNSGGGFTYQRSTDQSLSNNHFEVKKVKLFPNPTSDFLRLANISGENNIKVLDVCGKVVLTENIQNKEYIDVRELKSGLYFLYLDNQSPMRFLKN